MWWRKRNAWANVRLPSPALSLPSFAVVLHSNSMRGHTKAAMSLAAACAVGLLAYPNAQAHEDMPVVSGSVEALSGDCPKLRFRVGGQVVTTDARTEFDDGDCSDVKEGVRVEVEGPMDEAGVLLAHEVDLSVP
jgi:hypothetical protein